jgi:hypothetical protein
MHTLWSWLYSGIGLATQYDARWKRTSLIIILIAVLTLSIDSDVSLLCETMAHAATLP